MTARGANAATHKAKPSDWGDLASCFRHGLLLCSSCPLAFPAPPPLIPCAALTSPASHRTSTPPPSPTHHPRRCRQGAARLPVRGRPARRAPGPARRACHGRAAAHRGVHARGAAARQRRQPADAAACPQAAGAVRLGRAGCWVLGWWRQAGWPLAGGSRAVAVGRSVANACACLVTWQCTWRSLPLQAGGGVVPLKGEQAPGPSAAQPRHTVVIKGQRNLGRLAHAGTQAARQPAIGRSWKRTRILPLPPPLPQSALSITCSQTNPHSKP